MKKISTFFALILLLGCDTLINKGLEISSIDCPTLFFSLENNIYPKNDINNLDLNDIEYKATLNNYKFADICFADDINNNYSIDLLILAEPINPKDQVINLTLFVLAYDDKEKIIEKYFFQITENFKYPEDLSDFKEIEIIYNLKIIIEKNKIIDSITIGFVNIKN